MIHQFMMHRCRFTLCVLLALLAWASGLFSSLFTLSITPTAQAEGLPNSRLSQLSLNKPAMFLPSRLVLGQDNKFSFQGPVGSHVRLYFSPEPEGLNLPDGPSLRVGKQHETLEGEISDTGVLELYLPIPDDAELEGKDLFVEAVLWQAPANNEENAQVFQLRDATGRRTEDNRLSIVRKVEEKGTIFMPAMPGISQQLLRNLNNVTSTLQAKDERKKELLDTGTINRQVDRDKNSFILQPPR